MDFVSRDIISGLPNPLISHILSFLPTKEAASTSVLSKRWRFLFASVTNLQFENNENSISFMEFVDRVLALQGNGTVNRFSLDCTDYPDPVRVTGWIFNVLGRGVSDLDLLKYPKVNFSSLVEAHIGLRLTEDQSGDANFSEDGHFSEGDDDEEKGMVGNATDFLMGICNVQIL